MRDRARSVAEVRRLSVLSERAGDPDERRDEECRQRSGNRVPAILTAPWMRPSGVAFSLLEGK